MTRLPPTAARPAALGLVFALLALGGAAGCSDDDSPGHDGGLPDAALDAGPADAGSPDAAMPDPPCVTPLVLGEPFALDPDGPDSQFHVAAAFDGESVWVVYNRPDATNGWDVFGARLDCDGSHRVAPFRISTTDYNELDPALAVGHGHLYVAWQSDTGLFPENMELGLRTYLLDGTPVMAEDRFLETVRGGQTETGNHWLPAVAALPGGFAVAGARAVSDASAWQVFVQRLDHDGVATEESMDASFAPFASQTYPALGAAADGTLQLAYLTGVGPDWDDSIVHTTIASGATVPAPVPPVAPVGRTLASSATFAVGPAGHAYLAFDDAVTGRIVLTDGAQLDPGAPEALLGDAGDTNIMPVVAAAPGGGAVAWYHNLGGYFNNVLRVARFTYDGSAFTVGLPRNATEMWVPVYAPAITHVRGNVYFVAWSEGTSPDFRAMGVFLELD